MPEDELITYCGLYCGLCAERCVLPRMARDMLDTVRSEGYDTFYQDVPGLAEHYPSFMKVLGDLSCMDCKCRDGSGGPPGCEIRSCARGRGVFVCAECEDFACDKWNKISEFYPFMLIDAFRYQEVGRDRWLAEQREKARKGYNYSMDRRVQGTVGSKKTSKER